jgi:hypothetical protein
MGSQTFYYSPYETNTEVIIIETKNEVIISPNPTTDYIHLQLPESGVYTFQLFSLTGTKMLEQSVQNNITISLNILQKGVYIYKITGTGNNAQGKLIIK